VLFVVAAMAFAIAEPIQVLPRMELGPGFALTDQHGELVTSEDGRGAVTIYSFAPSDCDTSVCASTFATLAAVTDRASTEVDLDGVDFRVVTIALDGHDEDLAQQLQAAAVRSGADGQRWRWVGGSETEVANTVGLGFGRFVDTTSSGEIQFDPGYVLVDGNGVIRGDYRYETLADDADKLIRHLNLLGRELEHQDGATAVAYEAAHLFLCYP
jgi:protein SCO1/2